MADAPVVLLHGLATSAARTWGENGWLDIIGDSGRTVIAPDLPGHGAPPQPREPEAYADLAAQVAAGLPADVGPVDAVGFSLGAKLLLQMAVAEPDRFSHLVVAGVGANLFRHDSSGLVAAALRGEGDPAITFILGDACEPWVLEKAELSSADVVVKAAAVADFRPSRAADGS